MFNFYTKFQSSSYFIVFIMIFLIFDVGHFENGGHLEKF